VSLVADADDGGMLEYACSINCCFEERLSPKHEEILDNKVFKIREILDIIYIKVGCSGFVLKRSRYCICYRRDWYLSLYHVCYCTC
jgi:hypothetical protein